MPVLKERSGEEVSRHAKLLKLSPATAFLTVVVLTFICFLPDLRNELLDWDDSGYITYNEQIRTLSFETIRWAFTEFYCNYWAPLTWLSLALDYAFFGLNPVGYHLTNNSIHAVNAGLFMLLSLSLLRHHCALTPPEQGETPGISCNDQTSIYCSLLAALIFAIHPLRVESVVWATERKDVLSLLFGLLAVFAYLRYVRAARADDSAHRRPFLFVSSTAYWTMVVFFSLSLFSKAMFLSMPAILLILDWFPLKRMNRGSALKLLLEKIPLLIPAIATAVLIMQATAATRVTYADVFLPSRVLIVFNSLKTYLRLFIWPVDISPVYLNPGNISLDFNAVMSIVVIVGITLFCCIRLKQQPLFLALWLLFLIPLSPMLSVSGIHAMAPRFTYLPGLSLSFLVAFGVVTAVQKCAASRLVQVLIKTGTGVVLILLIAITVRDTGFWKNDITLWSRVIELEPHRFGTAYFQRSLFLNLAGEYQQALADVNEALAIALRKNYGGVYEIYAQRATILKNMRNYEGALADLSRAIEASGGMFADRYYKDRGEIYRLLGNVERANADFKAAGSASGTN